MVKEKDIQIKLRLPTLYKLKRKGGYQCVQKKKILKYKKQILKSCQLNLDIGFVSISIRKNTQYWWWINKSSLKVIQITLKKQRNRHAEIFRAFRLKFTFSYPANM